MVRLRGVVSPFLLRSNSTGVTDPRNRYSQIRPGLGDPAPYCDCSAKPDLISNNFVTLLVSVQYLLILCSKHCKDRPVDTDKPVDDNDHKPVHDNDHKPVHHDEGAKPVHHDEGIKPVELLPPQVRGKPAKTSLPQVVKVKPGKLAQAMTRPVGLSQGASKPARLPVVKAAKPATVVPKPAELQQGRSNEVEGGGEVRKNLLDELLLTLNKQRPETTTTTTAATTTTATTTTTTTTTITATTTMSIFERYFQSYFTKTTTTSTTTMAPPEKREEDLGTDTYDDIYSNKDDDENDTEEGGGGEDSESLLSNRVKKSRVVPDRLLPSVDGAGNGKRWRALTCPSYCAKDVEPVCGSDGVIYKNDCEMRKRTCNRDVKAVDVSDCTLPKGSKCEHKCEKDKDLVCGTDGRTYLNKCFLQVEFCERGIEFGHYGSCLNATSSALDEKCPKSCSSSSSNSQASSPSSTKGSKSKSKNKNSNNNNNNVSSNNGDPVCGSDGNVYPSECEMKMQTCGQGVVSVDRSHCQTTEHCESGCWRISRLTCGSDGKLYNNGCQMLRKNCGKHVFEVPVPYCLNKLYRTDCPLDCSKEKDDQPVCASDENIYSNVCEMKKMTCGFPLTRYERIIQVDWSLCAPKATNCAQIQCNNNNNNSNSNNKVCGNDGITYDSPCELSKVTCTAGVQKAHVGPCTDLVAKQEECPKECPKVEEDEKTKAVVCGSDGNSYKSECEMRLRTCGQRVTAAPLSHCKNTAFCPEGGKGVECPTKAEGKMVCGSDGKFYDGVCDMRKKNCGRHMYVSPISVCLQNFKFVFSGCGRVCPNEYDPVCGTDEKTYSNQCFMEMENCRARSLGGVTRKYFGKCGEPRPQAARRYLYRK